MGGKKIESNRRRMDGECAEERLRSLNQILKAIRNVNQLIVHEHDPQRLLTEACDILVQSRGYPLVWIGRLVDSKNCIMPAAHAGRSAGSFVPGLAEKAVRTHNPAICQDISIDSEFGPSKNTSLAHGFASCLAMPITHGDQTFGVLNVYADKVNAFFDEEIALIEEVAEDIAFALQSIEADTERRRAEKSLQESEERYRALFNRMTEGFALHEIICDDNGNPCDYRFLDVNPAFERLTGLKREDVIGRTQKDVLPGEDPLWIREYGAVALTGKPARFENYSPVLRRHYEVLAYRLAPRQFAVVFTDITKRKEAEEELRDSKDFLDNIINSIGDPLLVKDRDHRFVLVNDALCSLMGLPPEEIIGHKDHDFFPKDQADIFWVKDEEVLRSGRENINEEKITDASGMVRDIITKKTLYRDPSGNGFIVGTIRDITERKQAEEAYRVLVDSSLQGLIILQNSRAVFANEAYARMIGYTLDEILAMPFEEIQLVVHPDDRALVWSRFRDRLDGKNVPGNYEFRIVRKDSSVIWVEMCASLTKYKGKPAIQVAVIDITKRKQAEEALRGSESKLAAIIEFLPDATFVIDNKKTVIAWNRAMEEMTGVGRDEMIGQGDYAYTIPFYGERRRQLLDLLDISDDELASRYQYIRRKGNTLCAETYAPTLSGGRGAYVWATGAPIFDINGNRIGAIESIRDITERKRAERELQEQLNFLRQLTDTIPNPLFYKDTRGIYLDCNKAFEALTGLARDQIIGHTVYDVYPKDLADIYNEADDKLFQNPGVQAYEAAIAHADGNRHDVLFSKATYFDTEGKLAGLVGVILDITERKQIENALRESERRLADIINFLPDATFVIDGDGKVIAWNHAIEALTGIKAEDMLGMGDYGYALPFYGQRRPVLIDLVLRPQEEAEKEYSNIKREGGTLVGESYTPTIGSDVYLLGVASALYDSRGNIVGAIESIKDISERKRSEEALKSSLQEKEVLLKEVHHRVKNNLQIISSILNIQASYVHDEDTRSALIDSRSRVRSMALIHESLYRSENLARVNFADYIRNLMAALFSSYNADKGLIGHKLDLEEVFLEIDQAIPCGLILNELITNCLKHAFPEGTAGEIQLELHSSKGMIILAVKDNGIGLPAGFEPKSTKTMGLKIVSSLVRQLKGTLEIDSSEGTGFRVTFPMS